MEQERAYWTHEVAKRLDVGESTLRKWCLALEEQGYHFTKGEQESRAFLEQDIALLSKMKESIRGRKKSMKQAAIIALESSRTTLVQQEQNDGRTTLVPDVMELVSVALEEQDKQYAIQMKEQEEQFAEKMQKVLAEQLKLQERNLTANFQTEFNKFKDSIEETLGELLPKEKKPWWKKFLDNE